MFNYIRNFFTFTFNYFIEYLLLSCKRKIFFWLISRRHLMSLIIKISFFVFSFARCNCTTTIFLFHLSVYIRSQRNCIPEKRRRIFYSLINKFRFILSGYKTRLFALYLYFAFYLEFARRAYLESVLLASPLPLMSSSAATLFPSFVNLNSDQRQSNYGCN